MAVPHFKHSSALRRRSILLSIAAAALPRSASSSRFPSRPVSLVVPFAAGGTTDVATRKLAEILKRRWQQGVIVVNRPGAGTVIAAEAVARSAPDGHTILIAPDPTYSINPLIFERPTYDPVRDFAPVTTLITYPLGVAVSASLGASTLRELVALSKTRDLNYGSFGVGTAPHLVMESFKQMSGLRMEHIPYNGIAPVLLAMAAGDVHATVLGAGAAVPAVRSGKLRLLAMDERASLFPEVPTFTESGYPKLRAPSWWGVTVAADTPVAIVEQLHQDFVAALKDADFVAYLRSSGYEASGETPASLGRRMRDSREMWTPVVRARRIRVD